MDRRQFLGASALVALQNKGFTQNLASGKGAITSSLMLWTLKGSFEDKLEIAAKAGLQSVELVSEHAAWPDTDIERVKKRVQSFQMGIDTILAPRNWKTRPVTMVRPEHREGFLADVREAIVFARKLEVPQIILMSGDAAPERSHEEQYASMLEGGKRAAELAAKAGVILIIEPLNSKVTHKGCFLSTCTEGLQLVKDVDNPSFRLLFDLFHEQVQEGNIIATLTLAAPHVSVFHVADNPGRHDPGTGEMNYSNIFKAIRKTGYSGYIAMEYLPLGDPVTSLTKSLNDMRAALA